MDSFHSLDSFTSIFFKIRQKLNKIDDIDGGGVGGELEIKIRFDVPTVLPPPGTRPLTPGAIRLDFSHSLDSFTSIFFQNPTKTQ